MRPYQDLKVPLSSSHLMRSLTTDEEKAAWKQLKSPTLPVFPLLDGTRPLIPTLGLEIECLVRFSAADVIPGLLREPSNQNRARLIRSFCFSNEGRAIIRRQVAQTLRDAGAFVNEDNAEEDNGKWSIAHDNTIIIRDDEEDAGNYGWIAVEIKTPACNFHQKSLQHVFSIIKLITARYTVKVNESCGLHVHVGTRTARGQFNQLHPAHRVNNQYCSPLRTAFATDDIFEIHRRVRDAESMKDFNRLFGSQRRSINFQNLALTTEGGVSTLGKGRTIEFRQHAGTLDARRIVKWVQLCVGLVQWAHQEIGAEALMSSTFGFPQIEDRRKRISEGCEITLPELLRVLNIDARVVDYFSDSLYLHKTHHQQHDAEEELTPRPPSLENQSIEQEHGPADYADLNKELSTNATEALDRIAQAELENNILTKWKLGQMTSREYELLGKIYAGSPGHTQAFGTADPEETAPSRSNPTRSQVRARGLEASRHKIGKWCAEGGWGAVKGRPPTVEEWRKQMDALRKVDAGGQYGGNPAADDRGVNKENASSEANAGRQSGDDGAGDEMDANEEMTEMEVEFKRKMMLWEGRVQRPAR